MADTDDATRSLPPTVEPSQQATAAVATAIVPGDVFEDEPERYAIETQIGAGGMGTVLAARSTRLGRTVALKVVTADRDDLRRRFERETEVTARLQHPAIVPVYGAGRRAGQPFYAMKRVTGEPLDKVIASAATLAERLALLPKVLAVSEAIAYAHAQGVIHRDLKPANVLVGAFGETVVIDWGLAKELDRDGAGDSDGAAPDASPFRSGGDDATAHGKVMGTPAYMPLEQARGEAVDARADVYAVGAILYHVLAGASPYRTRGDDSVPWESMLARVLSAAPPPLDSVQPGVPRDLAAIVDKAMARRAADRYATAGELADDLAKFQTGQLVGAHTYSLGQLLRRWLRKHRTAVMVAAIAAVVLVVVGVLAVTGIIREQERTEEQRVAAVANRGEAEDLMGYMLVDLREKLKSIGKVSLLDDVATKARAYYDRNEELSPSELEKRGIAQRNLGDVQIAENHAPAAMAEYRTAVAIAGALAATDPSTENFYDLATSYEKIGDVQWAQGDTAGATATYKWSLELQQTAAARSPGDPKEQYNVALSHAAYAFMLWEQGDNDKALAEDREALAIVQPLASSDPKNLHWQDGVGLVHSRIGDVLLELGKRPEAIAEFRIAQSVFEGIRKVTPDDAGNLRSLAIAHDKIGTALATGRQHEGALAEYRTGLQMFEELAARDASNKDAQRQVAASHGKIGEMLAALGDRDGALVELRITKATDEALVAGDPSNAERQGDLAIALERIGNLLKARGDRAGALAEFRAEMAIVAALAAKSPSNVTRQRNLAVAHVKIGNIEVDAGDPASALAEYRIAADIDDKIQAAHPTPGDAMGAAIAHFKVARALAAQKDFAGALSEYEPLRAALDAAATKDPAADASDLAEVLEDVADAEAALGKAADAHAHVAAALAIVQRAAAKAPADKDLAAQALRLQGKPK